MDSLRKNFILFDGAMGTYIAQKYQTGIRLCEYENVSHPEHVLDVHREYIRAGADAIKTNTFSANTAASGERFEVVERLITEGCKIALTAAKGTSTAVFASIGPIAGDDAAAIGDEYRRIVGVFLSCGVTKFLFETFHDYRALIPAARFIKAQLPTAYVIAECTVAPDRYTKSGFSAQFILDRLAEVPEIDACGFNCTCGPMHMADLILELDFHGKTACVMPNAGYPTVIGGRTVFNSQPDYFAEHLLRIRGCGVKILGGCCGTTPLHIARAAALLRKTRAPACETRERAAAKPSPAPSSPVRAAKKRIAVELDSPLDADTRFFLDSAQKIRAAGADAITIADCPIGRARADSSMLAAKLRREFGIDAIPHLTCRDRNLNATKALLLAAHAEGVNEVLVVTGDPIPSSDRGEIKSVYNFNSVRLAAFISDLNGTVFSQRPFRVAAALNVNAANFTAELEKAGRKCEAGVSAFLTQPVFSRQAAENLRLAKSRLDAQILGGIMPVVSYKNGQFINNEIAGITIPEALLERYKGAGKAEAARIAVESSLETAERIAPYVDGYYIITPLRKTDIICEIVSAVKEKLQ